MLQIILKLLLICSFISSLYANEKVVLQLKWFHQFQFAGYYAAKEKGFYQDLGLDVEIRARDLKYNNVEQVINNEAQYGISDSILILYKAKKQPVVIVSPIFQHSASVFLSLKSSGIDSPYKLNDKDVLFYPNDTDGFSLLAMMKKLEVNPNLIRKREKNDYVKIINNEADMMPIYLSNEPFYFKEKNIEVNIINPMNYGFDFYGDMLFTNQQEVKNHPKRVEKFKAATLKGWKYALENKEEIINLIRTKYNSSKSLEHLRYEANAIDKLISKDIIPLGTIDKGRITYISKLYKEYGVATESFNINDFVFEEYSSKVQLTLQEKEYLEKHPTLSVQNLSSLPPFNFREDNKAKGYSIDYMKLMAETLGVNIEFISGKSWKESLELLKDNKLDIIPQVAINEERKKFIGYTNYKHVDYQTAFATRKEFTIKSFDDLKDKTLSVVEKSFLHTLLEKHYPTQKLHLAKSVKDSVESVSNGKADAAINNLASIEYEISENWLSNLKTLKLDYIEHIPINTPLYMGVDKDNLVLKSILEKTYKVLPYEKVKALKTKWFNNKQNEQLELTSTEYTYLQKKKELIMCIDPNWLPFEKIENGKHVGITAEYIKLFEKQLPIPITLKQTKNWMETLKSAQNKECDFITIMMKTQQREKSFNFTKPLLKNTLVIATKFDKPFIGDIKNIVQEKFAIIKGFAYKDILEKKYPNIKIVEVASAFDGLNKINNNEVYGYIDVLPAVGYSIQENFVGNLKIAGKLDIEISFPMAARDDEPLLKDIFNKLIDTITEDQNRELVNKWLSVKYEEKIGYTILIYLVLIFSVIIGTIIIKNRAINEINHTLSNYISIVDQNVLTSTTNKKGIIISVSHAFCDVSGYTQEELIGKSHRVVKHEDTPDELFENLWKTIVSGKTWQGEIKNQKKNGEPYWVSAVISPVLDKTNQVIGYTAIRHEITDKKRIEEISITDELTKLFNKRHFNEVLNRELNRAKRLDEYFSFMILDVDFFKQYNDFYGHQKGDFVLENIGQALKDVCQRSSDVPFRIGGEEFGILFTPSSLQDALDFAKVVNEKIESLQIEHELSSASNYITVSIGLYVAKGDDLDTSSYIYSSADKALYSSKENGRNQFTLYKKELSEDL
jgi:diguanylate cyclase (GGDEF)-like protein/PAS domain S-box-containing protein